MVSLKTAYIEVSLPKQKVWNVPLYDVIVWISTASTEEDQCLLLIQSMLLLHRCLFSPPTDSRM